MSSHRFSVMVLLVSSVAAGCASAPKSPVFGSWRIASYTSAGLSAKSPVQSLAWVGVSASFAPRDARVGGDRCTSPTYTPRTLSAAEFQQEYKVAVTTLGIAEPVTVYKLECGYDWKGHTNALIVKSPTTLLTPWEGTFFELEKTVTAIK